MRPQFRYYFQNIVDMMLNQKESIESFVEKGLKKKSEKRTIRYKGGKKNKTRKH